jgi:hypothetical protein
MKKFLLAGVLFSIALVSNSQISIAVKGGLTFADQYHYDDVLGEKRKADHLTELHTGLLFDIPFSEKLSLRPQLQYARKGAVHKGYGYPDTKVNLNYIEMPLQLVHKWNAGATTIFAGTGPVIGYGFGGEVSQEGMTAKPFKEYGGEDALFKRFDLAGSVTAGVEFNKLLVSATYQHGFIDIYRYNETVIRSRGLYLSVGYYFIKNK